MSTIDIRNEGSEEVNSIIFADKEDSFAIEQGYCLNYYEDKYYGDYINIFDGKVKLV